MRLAAFLVLTVAAPAAAAPCSVDLVRAPEDVREVVYHWVDAETRCATALEVRIVPSEDGLFVIARDDRGRIHDRTVPDAQTAGVLIASWAADDDVGLPPVRVVEDRAPAIAAVPRAAEQRWLRIEMFVGLGNEMLTHEWEDPHSDDAKGVRGSLGVWTHGGWTLDAALGVIQARPQPLGRPDDAVLHTTSVDAIASLGYALRADEFSFTPSLGLGLRYATYSFDLAAMHVDDSGLMLTADLALTAGYDVANRVQLTFGPVLTAYPDPWYLRQNLQLALVGGVGWAM